MATNPDALPEKSFLIVMEGEDLDMAAIVKDKTPDLAFNRFMESDVGFQRINTKEGWLHPREGNYLVIELTGTSFTVARPETLNVKRNGKSAF